MGTVCSSAVRPGRHRAGGKALVLQRGRLEFQLCSPPPRGPWACPWPRGLSSQGRTTVPALRRRGGPPSGCGDGPGAGQHAARSRVVLPKCRVPAISGMTFSFFFSSSLFSFFTPMKKSGAGRPLVPLVGGPTFGRSASTQSRLRGSHKLTGLRSCGNRTKAWEQEGPGNPV